MIERQALLQYLNSLLEPEYFKDYAPNGLQVQGKVQIKTLVTGVTATQALIERAVELDADALFVHHGYFWRGEDPSIVGMKYNRIKCLLEHQINLFAYHLPLDAHTELGNNAQLAQRLGLLVEGGLDPLEKRPIGNWGCLRQPRSAEAFAATIESALGRPPLLVKGGDHPVLRVAWCTG
ncbi:MAG: Nif3-like dinuclear metal center hexameric protein, partial [Ketobacter sp.]